MIYYFSDSICCTLHPSGAYFSISTRRLVGGERKKLKEASTIDSIWWKSRRAYGWSVLKPEKSSRWERGRSESLVMYFKRLFGVGWCRGGWKKGAGLGTQTNYHHIKYGSFYRFKNKPFITYVALQAAFSCVWGASGGGREFWGSIALVTDRDIKLIFFSYLHHHPPLLLSCVGLLITKF